MIEENNGDNEKEEIKNIEEDEENEDMIAVDAMFETLSHEYSLFTDRGLWTCYHCFEKHNSVVEHSDCKACHVGMNPYFHFIYNNVDPRLSTYQHYRSVLKKKYGLIKGKVDHVCLFCVFVVCQLLLRLSFFFFLFSFGIMFLLFFLVFFSCCARFLFDRNIYQQVM